MVSGKPDDIETKTTHRAEKWAEGVAAVSVLAGMRSCAAALRALDGSTEPFLASAIFSGLVVNYTRSFEEGREEKTGVARRFTIRGLPEPFNRSLHNAMLELRDQQVAHAGHLLNDYALSFLTVKFATEVDAGDSPQRKVDRRVVGTRARASFACGLADEEIRSRLLAHVEFLEVEASRRLGEAIVAHDLASLFKLKLLQREPDSHSRTFASASVAAPPGSLLIFDEEDLVFSRASSPDELPLSFVMQHFHLHEVEGRLALFGMTTIGDARPRT